MDNKKDQEIELDKLNLDTNEMVWKSAPTARDHREIGSKVATSPNSISNIPDSVPSSTLVPKPEQISDILKTPEAPVGTPDSLANLLPDASIKIPSRPKDSAVVEEALNIPFDKTALKTTDKLGQTGVAVVDAAVEKLNQDGDIASFYDTARQMMEANLDNSYNRKIGEGIK